LVVGTPTAGLEKVFSPNPNVGFISHALKYGEAIAAGQLLAPAKSAAEMTRIVVNDYIDATLAAVFVLVVVATVIYALINIWKALASPQATAAEIGLAGAVAGGGQAWPSGVGRSHRESGGSDHLLDQANGPPEDRRSRLRHVCSALASQPSGSADHDLCGVLPGASAGALCRRQGAVPRLLLARSLNSQAPTRE